MSMKQTEVYKIKMNTLVGIVKEIDNAGRIVIPKEFRERFGLTETVEIIATKQGVLLKSPEYKLAKITDED